MHLQALMVAMDPVVEIQIVQESERTSFYTPDIPYQLLAQAHLFLQKTTSFLLKNWSDPCSVRIGRGSGTGEVQLSKGRLREQGLAAFTL